MRKFAILGSLLILVFAQIVCCGGPNDGGGGNEGGNGGNVPTENSGGENDGDQSIGDINLIHSSVWAGPENSLSPVSGTRSFNNEEAVKIADGGKAYLDFHNQIKMTLYNDTEAGGIYGELDPNTPNYVRMKLFRGGLLGEVAAKGSTAEISVAFGSTIKVVGTTFFVIYDDVSGYVSAGNFDGEMYLYPNGGGEISLPPGTMVDIAPDGTTYFNDLRYDPSTFDSAADGSGSPVEGLKVLRKEFGQPLPGEELFPTEPPAKPITTVIRHLITSQNGSYVPDLATDWGVDPDGYIIEFHLQRGIFLPDGTPFTSSYVRDQLETKWQYAMEGNVSFELIDDLTIIFHLFSSAAGYVLDEMSIFEFEVQLGGPG